MRFLMILTGMIFICASGHSATWYVPDDYDTIQDAIVAADTGDTIFVRAGTYVENIDFLGKAVTVTSEDGPDKTVIDGNKAGSVVTFKNGEGLSSVLEGFTVTNGNGTPQGIFRYGGGVFCKQSSPRIRKNVFKNNTAYEGGGIYSTNQSDPTISKNQILNNTADYGGGIMCQNSSPEISDNTISGNAANLEGGGIMCWSNCHPTISGNTISGNTAKRFGGGIELLNNCSPSITDNIIADNKVQVYQGGGMVMAYDCSGTITNNVISGNTANYSGGIYFEGNVSPMMVGNTVASNNAKIGNTGGMYCFNNCQPVCIGCVFKDNAAGPNGVGGGFMVHTSCDATLTNCLFIGNTGGNGGGLRIGATSNAVITNCSFYGNQALVEPGGAFAAGSGLPGPPTTTITMTNCILWGNSAPNGIGNEISLHGTYPAVLDISYSDVAGGKPGVYVYGNSTLNWGPGMIDANPLFVDAASGDLHVHCTSPCCGMGDNSTPNLPSEDFEGDPRIADGTVDMGADEFHTHLYWTGVATPGGTVQLNFVGAPDTTQVALILGFNVFDPPLPGAYGDWHIAPPMILLTGLGPIPADGVYTLPGMLPTSIPGPYTLYLQAMIGSQLTNLSVVNVQH